MKSARRNAVNATSRLAMYDDVFIGPQTFVSKSTRDAIRLPDFSFAKGLSAALRTDASQAAAMAKALQEIDRQATEGFAAALAHAGAGWSDATRLDKAPRPALEISDDAYEAIIAKLSALSTAEFAAAFTELASRRPELAAVRDKVAVLLVLSPAMAEQAQRLGTEFVDNTVKQAEIETSARESILEHPTFAAREVAVALGKSADDRTVAARLRERNVLVGLPVGNGYRYPQFQIDAKDHEVRPEVAEVNQLLDASHDPWGVASWWLSPSPRLDDQQSPADLAVSSNIVQRKRTVALASALLDD